LPGEPSSAAADVLKQTEQECEAFKLQLTQVDKKIRIEVEEAQTQMQQQYQEEFAQVQKMVLNMEEEQQRRVEAERLTSLALLERDRTARLKRMAEEEEQRRQEEERCREENAMYSEELRLREFYEHRRSCKRREWRNMAWEDRRGSQVRTEERRMEELEGERLLREQRETEASQRRAMAREDDAAMRLREFEREQRERHLMAMADSASFALRDEVRREREVLHLARADVESQHWREASLAAAESQRMAIEDERSALLRHSYAAPGAAVGTRRRVAALGGHVLANPSVPTVVKPSAALGSLIQPPPLSTRTPSETMRPSTGADGGSKPVRTSKLGNSGVLQHRSSTSQTSLCTSGDAVIDPWDTSCKPVQTEIGRPRQPPPHQNLM